MKRLMAFMLCMAMCIGLVACAPSNAEQTTTPTTQATTQATTEAPTTAEPEELAVDHFKGTKLTIAVLRKATDTLADYNNKEIIKMVTEATGIETEWIVVDPNVADEKLATLLMSDDQPDIYLGFFSGNDTMLINNAELFYDLSEEGLLDTYAPNIVRDYDSCPVLWAASIMGDGSIRGLVTGGCYGDEPQGGATSTYAINQEWLDKANLPVPSTAEELYTALKYFKEHDMDGDGDPNNEIPMSFCQGFWEADLMMLAAPFGIAGNYTWQAHDHYKNVQNGKVVSTVDTENFRAFIEFFHKLYSEGLLDVEGFSQTKDQYNAKRNAKICGVVHTYTTLLDQGYTPFLYEGIEGVTPMISGLPTRFQGQRGNFAISAESENVEAALWWWNWMSKDAETKNIAAACSDQFVKDEDGNFWVNPEYAANGGVDTIDGLQNYSPVRLPGETARTRPEERTGASLIRYNFLGQYTETNMNQEGFPIMYSSDPAAVEERAFIETELYAYIATFTAEAIAKGIDDAKWEQHLNDLKAYQYYEWLGLYQDMIDEAAARVG